MRSVFASYLRLLNSDCMIKYGVFVSCHYADYQNMSYEYNFESKYTWYTDYMVYVCILLKFIKY